MVAAEYMLHSYFYTAFLESKSYNFMGLLTVMMLPKLKAEENDEKKTSEPQHSTIYVPFLPHITHKVSDF